MARRDLDKPEARNWRPLVLGLLVGVVLVALVVYGALRMMKNSKTAPPPREQQIMIMPQQAPPPPPPPPKEEPPPPPEEQKIEEPPPEAPPEQPADSTDEPAPGDDLGVDGEGSGSGDGFGLVAKKGGRGLIGGGDRNRWFAGQVQQDLQRQLAENEEARAAKYAVVVRLWFRSDGKIERYEMSGTVGDGKSEAALKGVLDGLRLDSTPPEDMPQPLKLRIVSR